MMFEPPTCPTTPCTPHLHPLPFCSNLMSTTQAAIERKDDDGVSSALDWLEQVSSSPFTPLLASSPRLPPMLSCGQVPMSTELLKSTGAGRVVKQLMHTPRC